MCAGGTQPVPAGGKALVEGFNTKTAEEIHGVDISGEGSVAFAGKII
jgi:hypothetical protein